MKIIRTIFFTAIIILALGSIYFGSYLPLRKSQKYIIALQRTSQIRNVQEFKNNFNPPLNFYSPVGQEEIVKFLTNDMASIIGRRGQQEEAVRALINYIEPYAIKNNVRHLLAIGRMYESLWLEHKKDNDFEKAEMYYLQALLIGPKLPPVLLSLLNLYKASGDQEKFEAITQKLVTYWPIIATLDGQSTTTAH